MNFVREMGVFESKEGKEWQGLGHKKKNREVLRGLERKNWELGVMRLIFQPYD